MATLIIDNNKHGIDNNSPIKETCKQEGIPFSCQNGVCGTCEVIIEEGEENLSEKSQEEIDMELPECNRLACQCKIKQGTVKVKPYW